MGIISTAQHNADFFKLPECYFVNEARETYALVAGDKYVGTRISGFSAGVVLTDQDCC